MPAEDDEKGNDKLMLKAQDALLRKMVLAMCKDLRVVILRLEPPADASLLCDEKG